MPPPLMAFVCIVGIVGLFVLDHDESASTFQGLVDSYGLVVHQLLTPCVPVAGTLSDWGAGPGQDMAQIYLEGSPVDGAVFSLLLLAGFIVLAHRSRGSCLSLAGCFRS